MNEEYIVDTDVTKTREDLRQEARIDKIEAETATVCSKINGLLKVIDSPKFDTMPDIDRNILIMELGALQSYHTALTMKLEWERVRIRTSYGARLNNDFLDFWNFLFGEPKNKTHAKKCSKKCNEKCSKKCNKKCCK